MNDSNQFEITTLDQVVNLDYAESQERNKSLVGAVRGEDGKLRDWDFGYKTRHPNFFGPEIPGPNGEKAFWQYHHLYLERINRAYVKLGPDGKPLRLYLFGQRLIGNDWAPEKSVCIFFEGWSEEYEWTEVIED